MIVIVGNSPFTDYLIGKMTAAGHEVVVARSHPLQNKNPKVSFVEVDVLTNAAPLETVLPKASFVISLLKAQETDTVAKLCLKHGKSLISAAPVDPSLEPQFKEKKVTCISHCSAEHFAARQVIDGLHEAKAQVVEFTSLKGCTPQQVDLNPVAKSFDRWPSCYLSRIATEPQILKQSQLKKVAPLENRAQESLEEKTSLEWFFTGDVTPVQPLLCLPEAKKILRGELVLPAWADVLSFLVAHQFLKENKNTAFQGKSVAEFTASLLKISDPSKLKDTVSNQAGNQSLAASLEFLGFFDANTKVPDHFDRHPIDSPREVVSWLLFKNLQTKADQEEVFWIRQMFEVEYTALKRETVQLTLRCAGKEASTIGRAAAIAVAAEHLAEATPGSFSQSSAFCKTVFSSLKTLFEVEQAVLPPLYWMRSEVKPGEERAAFSPVVAKKLLDAGYRVFVEHSTTRAIPDNEYSQVGCSIVSTGTWPDAPHSAFIFGLKELPEDVDILTHRHIFFAHCYKQQDGWKQILSKFVKGGGLLLDLEFLVFDNGRRVAAFGRSAGVAGMAVGLLAWAGQVLEKPLTGPMSSWHSTDKMVEDVKAQVKSAADKLGRFPKGIVIGALGRSGGGAVWFAEQCGVTCTKWDMAETQKGGPFPEIPEHEIFVNCIYLTKKEPPFVTMEEIQKKDRKLSVIVDVSCDPNNPNNPIPIYNKITSLKKPLLRVFDDKNPVDVVAIDHLPSLIPVDATNSFSVDLAPHLLDLKNTEASPVWTRAEELFFKKCGEIDG